ncbi:MAG: hypothetical protein EA357_10240 [Micavibrio sp.]|nr:MAG: hypothetical protein EA357_10240 [Micavibrio sp.]
MYHKSFFDIQLAKHAEDGDVERMQWALDKGADVHYANDSALQWACNNGHPEAVCLLLENGADIHVSNDYPLQCAAKNNHTDVMRILLENGADFNKLPEADRLRHMEVYVAFKTETLQKRFDDPYQLLNDHTVLKFEGKAQKLGEICKIFDFSARTVTQTVDKVPAEPMVFDQFRNNRKEILEVYDWLKNQGRDAPHPFGRRSRPVQKRP